VCVCACVCACVCVHVCIYACLCTHTFTCALLHRSSSLAAVCDVWSPVYDMGTAGAETVGLNDACIQHTVLSTVMHNTTVALAGPAGAQLEPK